MLDMSKKITWKAYVTLFLLVVIMLAIPTRFFIGIDWYYGVPTPSATPGASMDKVLGDAQKGAGG